MSILNKFFQRTIADDEINLTADDICHKLSADYKCSASRIHILSSALKPVLLHEKITDSFWVKINQAAPITITFYGSISAEVLISLDDLYNDLMNVVRARLHKPSAYYFYLNGDQIRPFRYATLADCGLTDSNCRIFTDKLITVTFKSSVLPNCTIRLFESYSVDSALYNYYAETKTSMSYSDMLQFYTFSAVIDGTSICLNHLLSSTSLLSKINVIFVRLVKLSVDERAAPFHYKQETPLYCTYALANVIS